MACEHISRPDATRIEKWLGIKPIKFQKVHDLTDDKKKIIILARAKKSLGLAEDGELPNLHFCDMKALLYLNLLLATKVGHSNCVGRRSLSVRIEHN